MPKNKIRVIHFGLSQNLGGIETYLHKITSRISRDSFSFSFMDTTDSTPYFYEDFKMMGCDFYKITSRRKSPLKNLHDVEALFKAKGFDIFHCHLNTLSYISPIFLALKYGVKVIVHSRNSGAAGSKITHLMHYINQHRFPKDDVTCVAVSQLAGEWLFGKEAKFKIFNNGIELDTFQYSSAERKRVRQSLKIEGDQVVLGNVGAFLPAKNQPFVIDVFSEALKHMPRARLLLVGEGRMKADVQARAESLGVSEYVYFLGRRNDMPSIYSAMDAMLFPSFYEGFPNAVLEAQATGLPCLVSTNVTDEVIIQKNSRRIPLDSSATSWARQVIELLHAPSVDRFLAHHIIADAGFSVEDELARVEDLYLSVLNKKSLLVG